MKPSLRQRTAALVGLGAILVLAAGYFGLHWAEESNPLLNDEVVDPGRLIRSAQPRAGDLDRILKEHGLGTILCLRGHETEEATEWARARGVKLVCLAMKADQAPTPEQAAVFFDLMRGRSIALDQSRGVVIETLGVQGNAVKFPLPVLIHCEGGADRTGVMVALYRMGFQGWDLKRAKQDMLLHFHLPFNHPAQFRFLEETGLKIIPGWDQRVNSDPGPGADPEPGPGAAEPGMIEKAIDDTIIPEPKAAGG